MVDMLVLASVCYLGGLIGSVLFIKQKKLCRMFGLGIGLGYALRFNLKN